MRVCIWHSDKPREHLLASAWKDGVEALGAGDTVELRALKAVVVAAECDVAVMFGVKSRELYRAHVKAGAHVIYVDKGYSRHKNPTDPTGLWEYWRVALDAHQPTGRLFERSCPPDRWERLGLELKPWRKLGVFGSYLLAGSSEKYHAFHGLSGPTEWAEKVVARIKAMDSTRPIVYRPKPSWTNAVPIKGTIFSGPDKDIDAELAQAFMLVTHGSNAAFDAMLAGVPAIILGDAVTRELSLTTFDDGPYPRRASEEARLQWAFNIAYFQWTLREIADGKCWAWLRPMIYGRAE